MTDDNERARFDAWWLSEDGPYSIRAEQPSSMTEAAWMGWRAREAENAKLRAALECVSLMKAFPDDEMNRMSLATAIRIARAALGGTNG